MYNWLTGTLVALTVVAHTQVQRASPCQNPTRTDLTAPVS
jgi:hypothetical protein